MRGTLIVYAHHKTFELLASERRRFYGHRTRFFDRLYAAWLVFSGRADALCWDFVNEQLTEKPDAERL